MGKGEKQVEYEIFKLLVDSISYPIWIKDLDLRFIYANKEYINLCKGKDKEFIGKKYEEVFNKEIDEKEQDKSNFVINTLKPLVDEWYINGISVMQNIFPLISQNGELKAIVCMYSDLNIIKQKNKVIEEQKNILKVVMDTLPGMVFYKDKHGRYVYVNKEFNKFYNSTSNEALIGKTNFDIHPTVELARKYTDEDNKVLSQKESIHTQTVLNSNGGKELYTEAIKVPVLDENNEASGIVGLVLDVTKKIEYQKKLKTLSFTDILTGLYNRAYFEKKAKEFMYKKYLPIGVIMGDANGLKLVNDALGHTQGDKLLKLIANVFRDVCNERQLIFRTGGDEFVILMPNTADYECEAVIRKIFKRCKAYKHDLIDLSISLGYSIVDNLNKNIYDALKEAEDKVYRQKLLQKNSLNNSMMYSLQVGLHEKSLETEEHTERVLKSSLAIGEKLLLPTDVIDELTIVAKLHDIGKIAISEEILLKRDTLTKEEFEIVKAHTEKGYRIIKAVSQLDNVAKGVLTHHERWDGKGYPLKLKGESIPLISRIVSIADSYDAMTNNNIYKKSLSKKDAIRELKECAGTQFDPDIVDIFVKYLKELE